MPEYEARTAWRWQRLCLARKSDDDATQEKKRKCGPVWNFFARTIIVGPAFALCSGNRPSGLASYGRGGYRVGSSFFLTARVPGLAGAAPGTRVICTLHFCAFRRSLLVNSCTVCLSRASQFEKSPFPTLF